MREITLNGEAVVVEETTSIEDLISVRYPSTTGIAVAIDGTIVPRSKWNATELPAGGKVEVITAVAGG
ncbi:MAG: sulfur carrier protein ThiS [Actinobacteria bacterium]|nr:sulfur carrier protein ThiS [Actinomycetota bacterium]MCL5445850.1 sulfur carrier protein ThiS [Actinomycetota bacterium]